MILPLYPDCVSELELLLALLSDDGKLVNGEGEEGAPSPAYDAVRKTFAAIRRGRGCALEEAAARRFPRRSRLPAATPTRARRHRSRAPFPPRPTGLARSDLRHRRLGL
jgi:hypothetical protein